MISHYTKTKDTIPTVGIIFLGIEYMSMKNPKHDWQFGHPVFGERNPRDGFKSIVTIFANVKNLCLCFDSSLV